MGIFWVLGVCVSGEGGLGDDSGYSPSHVSVCRGASRQLLSGESSNISAVSASVLSVCLNFCAFTSAFLFNQKSL